jgi:7-cyano-7-deazaguanine synthase
MKKAIILFSGGLDSTTCLALAKSQGFDCYALSFDYGQKHSVELSIAKRIAEISGVQHIVMQIPVGQLGGSALTDATLVVPDQSNHSDIPVTYVPARNTIFLSFALGLADCLQSQDIFIGVSAIDYSGYPDCRPEYIAAFQKLANLATKTGLEEGNIQIYAPLIHLSKAETIQLGISLGVDYAQTVSCYRADKDARACGKCDSCVLRKKGFKEANVADPTRYY